MESLKAQMIEGRKLAPNTVRVYSGNLEKLAYAITGKQYENMEFSKDYKGIMDFIKDLTLSTIRNYIATLIVGLSPMGRDKVTKGYEELIKIYKDFLITKNIEYNEKRKEQTKSQKEKENWVGISQLEAIRVELGKKIKKKGWNTRNLNKIYINGVPITQRQLGVEYDTHVGGLRLPHRRKDKLLLQKYLVASLYLLHPPRRNEYGNMKIISHRNYLKLEDNEKLENWLVIISRNKKFFHFGKYKTFRSYGIQKVDVCKELNQVINLCTRQDIIKANARNDKTPTFLYNSHGGPMCTNLLTKFLYNIFSETGKNIGSNLIRHIYLSEKYGNDRTYQEKEADAVAMGHSISTQQLNYVKVDE